MIFKVRRSADHGSDSLFALTTAAVSLDTRLGIRSSGRAAICLHDTDGTRFSDMIEENRRFLDISKDEFHLSYEVTKDSLGYIWFVLHGGQIEDLVTAVNAIGETVMENGFQSQLLASLFEFKSDRGPDILYLIYNYKQNLFYPFVPMRDKTRNNEIELRILALMKEELPMQEDLELWYPMWDMPIRN